MADLESPKPGIRVGVFHSYTEESLLLFGYGVYEGDEVPPEDILAAEIGPPALINLALPKLRLDDGTVIWGCECWWNTEPMIKALEEGRTIIKPKLDSLRAKATEAWKQANEQMEEEEERLP